MTTVYRFHPTTGEYLGSLLESATNSPATRTDLTYLEPPTPGANQVPCFQSGAWSLVADYRDGQFYDADGNPVIIDEIGETPDPSWTTEPPLTNFKTQKLKALKSKRDEVLNGGFTWDTDVFDSDETAQLRLLGLYTSAVNTPGIFPVDWRLQDNSWRSLSAADAEGVWGALQAHIASCFSNFSSHEGAISALTTISAVQAYDISTGWPS